MKWVFFLGLVFDYVFYSCMEGYVKLDKIYGYFYFFFKMRKEDL